MKNLTDFPMWKSRKQIQWHNESQAGSTYIIYVLIRTRSEHGSSRLLSTWPNIHIHIKLNFVSQV